MSFLQQGRLTKQEWVSIESRINPLEVKIAKMIHDGFLDTSCSIQIYPTLKDVVKISHHDNDYYIYIKFIHDKLIKLEKKSKSLSCGILFDVIKPNEPKKKLNKVNLIKLDNQNIDEDKTIEFIILKELKHFIYSFYIPTTETNYDVELSQNEKKCVLSIFNIQFLYKKFNNVINIYLKNVITFILEKYNKLYISDLFKSVNYFITSNSVLNYRNLTLYEHQQILFDTLSDNKKESNLIYYVASTGTGKTLTPLGLTHKYKVIFMCASKHIGLNLAKYAINIGIKIGFAFGCSTSDDIRLHFNAISEYEKIKNRNGHEYKKPIHSNGSQVDILICDILSFDVAQLYMKSFFNENDIILFWDEPTISLDYDNHFLHDYIKLIWNKNTFMNVILSSATLPHKDDLKGMDNSFIKKQDELYLSRYIRSIELLIEDNSFKSITSKTERDTIKLKISKIYKHLELNEKENVSTIFDELKREVEIIITNTKYNGNIRLPINKSNITYIETNDQITNISLLDLNNNIIMPHNIFKSYSEIIHFVNKYGIKFKKFIDLNECIKFISFVTNEILKTKDYFINNFDTIEEIEGNKIKTLYYDLILSLNMDEEQWVNLLDTFYKKYPIIENPVSMLLTTQDSYTLTNGPSIYLTEDVENVSKYLYANSKIDKSVLENVKRNIDINESILENINIKKKQLDDKLAKDNIDEDKCKNKMMNNRFSSETKLLKKEIEKLENSIMSIQLQDAYIPNRLEHFKIWNSKCKYESSDVFTCCLDNTYIKLILKIEGISYIYKILLLMGIGIFNNSQLKNNIEYTELVKKMADEKQLYLIIANSDYIYGTNYQFSHAFFGKDILNITQEKTIQGMGRVGRKEKNKRFTFRFRNAEHIRELFSPKNTIEIDNINKLFI